LSAYDHFGSRELCLHSAIERVNSSTVWQCHTCGAYLLNGVEIGYRKKCSGCGRFTFHNLHAVRDAIISTGGRPPPLEEQDNG